MLKPFIAIKKVLWVKPKWRVLRIGTKIVRREKLETILRLIEMELDGETDQATREYLRGKKEIITLLLK